MRRFPRLRSRCVQELSGILAFGMLAALFAAPVEAQVPKALINAATVSGGASSQEAVIATSYGYQVDIVSDSTWASMTAAQFGAYDLLIAGDPTCGSLPNGLLSSAPVWGSVVLGRAGGRTLAGNRILIGTDPVFHDGGHHTPRATIIRDGIKFAGKQQGRTGMYFTATCGGWAPALPAALAAMSEGTGSWTVNASPPCGGAASLIAFEPSFADLTSAQLQGWGCSVHESFPTFPSDWSALAVATDTATKPTCGVDPNTGVAACGQAYILIAGSSIVVTSANLSLTPLEATNPVGTSHTVTAHVTRDGAPVVGQVVSFTVTGVNAGAAGNCIPGSCQTDSNGDVSFTYLGSSAVGDDTIKASFKDVNGGLQSATAQKHWVKPADGTPPVVTVQSVTVVATGPTTPVSFTASATDETDGTLPVSCSATSGGSFPVGGTLVTCTATDAAGNTGSGNGTITVTNTKPTIGPLPDITVHTRNPAGVSVSYAITGNDAEQGTLAAVCTPVSGTHFGIGATPVSCAVSDVTGASASGGFKVIVILDNEVPVCSTARPSVSSLWPPNHTMVPIQILGATDADGDAIKIAVSDIHQDEPTSGLGDGDTPVDGGGIGTSTPSVRAERSGKGDGRVYYISFTVTDTLGGSCKGTVTVGVPHDQKGGPAVGGGPLFKSMF